MVFRCVRAFETREGSYPVSPEEGTIWMASYARPQNGYELVMLEELRDGALSGRKALVRASALSTNFEMVPPEECHGVIGCFAYRSRGSDE